MVTRSIVGRFLILAVLLVSLGVIAQAALIISKESGKSVAKVDRVPNSAVAALAATPAAAGPAKIATSAQMPAATPTADPVPATGAQPIAAGDTAPVRVVYPGPLGDTPLQPRRIAAANTAAPVAPAPAAAQPAAVVQPAAAPAPAVPAPVVVAAASADTQPTPADTASAGKGGLNLNNASIDALNHLGGGHIGQTIVQHRPYRSVEDLVKKRVVRRSVYEQIKNQVAAE